MKGTYNELTGCIEIAPQSVGKYKGYEYFEIYCDTPAESAVDYWRHPYRHWQFLANEYRNQSGV